MLHPTWPLILLLFRTVSTQNLCHETSFTVGDKYKFNVNHLKDHKPPSQKYTDKSNIYGFDVSSENVTLFNLADIVRAQDVDGHKVQTACAPRSLGPTNSTNRPAACSPESEKNLCPNSGGPCWIALGSCNQMTASLIDESDKDKGLHILYKNGDYKGSSFLVTINCCTKGACLDKKGLDSPATFKTSDCPLEAATCAEITSPFGCDCDSRAALDIALGKQEFHCDATPSGLSNSTSTGTLLLIFFFVIVGLYLAIGMGYNYKEGRRGEEMVPHLDMWKDLGGLIYDGFMYVKSCGEYREGVQYDTIG